LSCRNARNRPFADALDKVAHVDRKGGGDDGLKRTKAGRSQQNQGQAGVRLHAVIFVLANIIFVVGWAMTGAGYFWPIWPFVGWGMGLAFHGWSVHFERPISEDEIRRELEKGRV